MVIRTLSGIVLFPVLLIIVIQGGLLLKIGTICVSLIGMYEFYRAIFKKIIPINYLGFITAIVYLSIIDTPYFGMADIIFGSFILISLIFMVINHKSMSIFDVALTFFGICYIPVMFSSIYLITEIPFGYYTVWLPFICAWVCDTGAYFVGKTFGKHKLTPELSPKKTIEGAIGGIVFSSIACVIYAFFIITKDDEIINVFGTKTSVIYAFLIIGIVGAIFAQFGDLTASAIKRRYNIKDYGNLIPGHGGILDRFDSVIFTSGICYVILKVIEIFGGYSG